MDFMTFIYIVAANVVSRFVYDGLKKLIDWFKGND